MKNIFFAVLSLLAMGPLCASCDDDIDTSEGGYCSNPAAEIVGTYTGVWTVSESGVEKPNVNGSVTFSPISSPDFGGNPNYAAQLSLVIDGYTDNAIGVVNVVKTANGINFSNMEANAAFGALDGVEVGFPMIQGTVVNGECKIVNDISVTIEKKEGRKTVKKQYRFKFN